MQDIDDNVTTPAQCGPAARLDKGNVSGAESLHVARAADAREEWGRRLDRTREIRGADAVEPRLRGLAALLLGCARGDAGDAMALRRWEDGRLRQLLARMLDDADRADAALDLLVKDLSGGAGAFRGNSEAAAQDWLFARMRLAARETGGLRQPRPPERPDPVLPAPQPAPPHRPSVPDREPAPPPMGLANPRLRPPTAPVRSARPRAGAAPPRRRRGGGWLGVLLLLATAAAVGMAASLAAVRWLAPEPPELVAEIPPPPVADVAPAAPPPAPEPQAVPEQVGPPIAGLEPPAAAEPAQPAPPPPPAVPAAGPRVVLHHGTDPDSTALAAQLAAQLTAVGYAGVEVRAVTFDVATASIRYFYGDDRGAAERLIRAVGPVLAWNGRAAPSTPIGFTDFRPLPRPGTIEIWLPRR